MIGERLASSATVTERRNGRRRAGRRRTAAASAGVHSALSLGYRARDAAVRRFSRPPTCSGSIAAARRSPCSWPPRSRPVRLGPGLAPRLGGRCSRPTASTTATQADQPHDRRRPPVDLPRGPGRLASAARPTTSCSPCTAIQLRPGGVFGVIAMLAVPGCARVARRLAVSVARARARAADRRRPEIATAGAQARGPPRIRRWSRSASCRGRLRLRRARSAAPRAARRRSTSTTSSSAHGVERVDRRSGEDFERRAGCSTSSPWRASSR